MATVNFLPLVVAVAIVVAVVVGRLHAGVDRAVTRLSLGIFGDAVAEFRGERPERRAALRSAHLPTTYREYGSKTLLYAAAMAVVGSILGMYVIWAVLLVLSIDPATMRQGLPGPLAFLADVGGIPTLSLSELFALMLASCLTLGVVAGGGTYWLRWWYPSYLADDRGRAIDAALPSTVAFVFALSRSGMAFPTVTRIVAANRDTYGAAADEFGVAVRDMDTFGTDVVSALQEMGRRTPSDDFREFSENLVSVLQSGHSLSEFLERQYHEYREEAEAQQESLLELLGTLAEAYVTVLVAGPLFLIVLLVVIGFSIGETIDPLRALVYLILPFGNLAFIVYLGMVTDSLTPGRTSPREVETPTPAAVERVRARRTDGGYERPSPTVERLRIYRRLRDVRRAVGNPLRTLIDRPKLVFAITVPIAAAAILRRLALVVADGPLTLAAVDEIGWELLAAIRYGRIDPAAIDGTVALAGLFVLGSFAAVYEVHRYRIEAIEAAVPDLLDRLASVNEAGMPIITAIDHVRDSEMGALDEELDRIWADVQWGADLETALYRFGARVRTRTTSRVVTLLTEAMNASGSLATVLRIAARQAAADRRLERRRRQAMLEYMIVVYVSFLVFLFIIAVLSAYLLPNLPTEPIEASGAAGAEMDGFGGLGEIEPERYTRLFYHATLLQGLLSGLIAGQLSTGDVKAGAKHATFMVAVTYLLFSFVL